MPTDHPPEAEAPVVSVLMPTFKHAAFIRRALESLQAQTLRAWELIVVDDGSPDETPAVIGPYLRDRRIHYHRLPANRGLGAALNLATRHARGRYLAYLPSDDVYYPDHLAALVETLDADPGAYLAYGGVRWAYERYGATLQGDGPVGHEAEALAQPASNAKDEPLPSRNILALVQVMHRRDHEAGVHWPERDVVVSDRLEPDFWRALLARGARFAYAGAISCEWVEQLDQRHEIIAGNFGGLARYRRYYGIGRREWLNFQPSRGVCVDERSRFGRFDAERDLPAPGGLKILLAGELGFNPERIVTLEERGHKLYGLWMPQPHPWDATGPVPYGNMEDIPYAPGWPERVREIRPDIIYAMLNWQGVSQIDEIVAENLGIPLVYHFKEGPFILQKLGLWPAMMRILDASDGRVFISPENLEWFQLATDGMLDPETTFVLDGDLPKADWMTEDWAPKLSREDGAIHTVCPGRPLGLDPFEGIAEAGIHVHFYGQHFQQQFPNWTRKGLASGFMHIHPTVEPADWVRELSRYDAAWFHVFDSYNKGDLRRAHWDDLNLPARLGTYAAAGLPWILKDNRHSRVAVQSLAQQHDVGIFFNDWSDLARQLGDRERVMELNRNMRAARHAFAFDTHVDDLVAFFRRAIARRASGAGETGG